MQIADRQKIFLLGKVKEAGKETVCLVRIACKEIESFFLADLAAVECSLGSRQLSKLQPKKIYRSPDQIPSPSSKLKSLTKNRYEKVSGSRVIAPHMNIENERSSSFNNLISAIKKLEQDLLST